MTVSSNLSSFRVFTLLFVLFCMKAAYVYDGFDSSLPTPPVDTLPFQICLRTNIVLLSYRKLASSSLPIRPCETNFGFALCLLLAGDIELNPGPRRPKYPCGICNKAVKQNDPSVLCDQCGLWVHNTCSGLSSNLYHILQHSDNFVWICPSCGMPSFSSSFFLDSETSVSNSFSPLASNDSNSATFNHPASSTPLEAKKSSNSTINQHRVKKGSKYKVMSLNLNGIRSKIRPFHELLLAEKPDIVICQETRVDNSVLSSEIYPPDYIAYRKDRDIHGGGVSILIRKSLTSSQCVQYENDSELTWVALTLRGNRKLYIGSFYRPPNKNSTYIELLRESLDRIYLKHVNKPPFIILCGDFNYPHINWANGTAPSVSDGKNLLDIANDFHLNQLVETPTYLCRGVNNILDLVLTSHPSLLSNVSVGQEFSDHCIVFFTINELIDENPPSSRKIFLLDKGNYNAARKDMELFKAAFFSSSPGDKSVNENWNKLKQAIATSMDKNIPTKIITSSYRKPAWITSKVKKAINKRNRLASKAKRSGSKIDQDRFRKARNDASNLIDDAYSDHLNKILNSDNANNREFYRFIKSRKTENMGIPDLISGLDTLKDDCDKAECLNKYFCSVFTQEDPNFTPLPSSPYPQISKITVTANGVQKLLESINGKKSSGPDDISPRILKELSREIAPILTFIFNQSIEQGTLPNDWLTANVFALHKKGPKDVPENYRPISLTSVCCKILEHIVYSAVSNHLESNNIFTPRQHGFRSGYSCESQLILALNDWAQAIDTGFRTDVAVFDFSKAFDKVPHERLLAKLSYYGIGGSTFNWIAAFLHERTQRVVLNGCKSKSATVISGVPQGTVLGPLLFLIYINDIVANIKSEIRLFADDCILYRKIATAHDCQILQQDMDSLFQWSKTWQMEFNVSKCNVMSISRAKKRCDTSYSLGGVNLARVHSFTYLGIEISSDLRWNKHVAAVVSKASRSLNFVRRNLYRCNSKIKELSYMIFVRPLLEYATAAWDPHTACNIRDLEMVQRRAARFVKKDYKRTTSVTSLIDSLGWQSLQHRRRNARLINFFKAQMGNPSLFHLVSDLKRPSRLTRSTSCSAVPTYSQLSCRTDVYKFSFLPRTVVDWNDLDTGVRGLTSLDTFRSRIAAPRW